MLGGGGSLGKRRVEEVGEMYPLGGIEGKRRRDAIFVRTEGDRSESQMPSLEVARPLIYEPI